MSDYKYSFIHKDKDISKIQRETQDKFAAKTELADKMDAVKKFVTLEPKLTDLKDGQKKYYNDGTNFWRYERIGSKLFKIQLTEI